MRFCLSWLTLEISSVLNNLENVSWMLSHEHQKTKAVMFPEQRYSAISRSRELRSKERLSCSTKTPHWLTSIDQSRGFQSVLRAETAYGRVIVMEIYLFYNMTLSGLMLRNLHFIRKHCYAEK